MSVKKLSRLRLASALSDAVSLMRGYVGHAGVIHRHHPLMEKVTDANQDFMRAVFTYEERQKNRRKVRSKVEMVKSAMRRAGLPIKGWK